MKVIHLIEITPEQLRKDISQDLQNHIEVLKKEFQPKEPDELMTINEAKDMLKVDRSTIYNWIKRGKLRQYGLGARVYLKRSEILAAIKPLN